MLLELGEGRVYGARYHTVSPIFDWELTSVEHATWRTIMEWCVENYGTAGSVWELSEVQVPLVAHRWYANNAKFWFRNQEDLTLFVLKWQ